MWADEAAAPVFSALGDRTRLAILGRLSRDGPQSVSRLAQGLPVTRQAVSKHLAVLAQAGLVRDTPRGRERVWEVERAQLDAARAFLDEVSAQWDVAIRRLRALVEDDP